MIYCTIDPCFGSLILNSLALNLKLKPILYHLNYGNLNSTPLREPSYRGAFPKRQKPEP